MYLLDTNHCSRIMDGDPAVLARLRFHQNALIATSVIVEGELTFMAERSARGEINHSRVKAFLLGIRIYPVDSETARHYGLLKAAIVNHFGPREKTRRRRVTLPELGFSDNDLWIVAAGLRRALTIVSSDSDCKRMQQAMDFRLESWLAVEPTPE